jgi:hypothetical protein
VSFGHARALAGFESHKEQCTALETIVRGELSVRATEQLVRGDVPASGGVTKPSSGDASKAPKVSPEVPTWQVDFKRRIEEGLGLAAELRCSDSYEGQVLLKFNDRRQLEHLMDRLAPTKKL